MNNKTTIVFFLIVIFNSVILGMGIAELTRKPVNASGEYQPCSQAIEEIAASVERLREGGVK